MFIENYDYAVCYHMHSPLVLRYVADKVNADKKIVWIHNDFKTTNFKVQSLVKWLDKYDLFVSVSKRLNEEFVELCPQYVSKAIIAYNVIDAEEIQFKSQNLENIEKFFLTDNRFKILTVGRFVEQKGFDLAIQALKLIVDQGLDISWYVIGYGKDENKMKNMIEENNLQEKFIILGRKVNPYPYMRNCDLYVQPSRHEGFGLTLAEAKVLNKYIICTNFAGADEQIKCSVNGEIVPDFTPETIAKYIIEYIKSPRFSKNMDENNNWEVIFNIFK